MQKSQAHRTYNIPIRDSKLKCPFSQMLCVILILLSIVIRYFLQFNNDLFLFYGASYVSSVAILHSKRKSRRYVMEHILQAGHISVQRQIYGRPSYFISLLLLIETSWHLSRRNMIFTALATTIVWLHDGRIFLRKMTEDRDRIKVSSRNADDVPCFFFVHCFSCDALRHSWAPTRQVNSSYSRHIDSREVCQSPTPSIRSRNVRACSCLTCSQDVLCPVIQCRCCCFVWPLCFVSLRCAWSSCACWAFETTASTSYIR